MRFHVFGISFLLLAGVFCVGPSVKADSLSSARTDNGEFAHGFTLGNVSWHGAASSDLNLDRRGGYFGSASSADDPIHGFIVDQAFDSTQSDSPGKHDLFFNAKWNPDRRWDWDHDGDFRWWRHDRDRSSNGGDPGTPSVPTPEPESLWLFLTGVSVVGLCSILRRKMPTILS